MPNDEPAQIVHAPIVEAPLVTVSVVESTRIPVPMEMDSSESVPAPAAPTVVPDAAATPAAQADKFLHPGVVCDGCDNIIIGFRYKCMDCNDYDLCMECEAGMKHSQHVMLRIANPNDVDLYKLKLRKRLTRHRRSEPVRVEENVNEAKRPHHGHGHHDRRGHGKRHSFTTSPFELLGFYNQHPAAAPANVTMPQTSQGTQVDNNVCRARAAYAAAKTASQKANAANANASAAAGQQTSPIAACIQNIPELIRLGLSKAQSQAQSSKCPMTKASFDTLADMANNFAVMMDPFASSFDFGMPHPSPAAPAPPTTTAAAAPAPVPVPAPVATAAPTPVATPVAAPVAAVAPTPVATPVVAPVAVPVPTPAVAAPPTTATAALADFLKMMAQPVEKQLPTTPAPVVIANEPKPMDTDAAPPAPTPAPAAVAPEGDVIVIEDIEDSDEDELMRKLLAKMTTFNTGGEAKKNPSVDLDKSTVSVSSSVDGDGKASPVKEWTLLDADGTEGAAATTTEPSNTGAIPKRPLFVEEAIAHAESAHKQSEAASSAAYAAVQAAAEAQSNAEKIEYAELSRLLGEHIKGTAAKKSQTDPPSRTTSEVSLEEKAASAPAQTPTGKHSN